MFILVPAPIQLKHKDGQPMKIQTPVNGVIELVDHAPASLHDFLDEHVASQASTFKEQRQWVRILDRLKTAEEERAAGVEEVYASIDAEDFNFCKQKMEQLSMNGLAARQFLPFFDAIETARAEKPKAALKAIGDGGAK